ncbi:citrulline utilization hydrolase CtlX [Nesterenkonia muleiensis]|uniref:citrulline utilization hydrolase CtlX n=1 Tax=Nesterenkonia muleiensis TaxID=2282648 RepID=UPI00192E6292|nr:arginine deiminase-related protein [Nesterenkonia muleiensis]
MTAELLASPAAAGAFGVMDATLTGRGRPRQGPGGIRPPAPPAQAPAHVAMVRPHRFTVNLATAADNAYQRAAVETPDAARLAYEQSSRLAEALAAAGVGVSLFDDEHGLSPDSVFPNNWFTTHPAGQVVLCPMYAQNRRQERRGDVVEHLRAAFQVSQVVDLSAAEEAGQFLEGTGAVVIDHAGGLAYGCRSHRLSQELFQHYCRLLGLEPVLFDAADAAGKPVFHTNIMLSVGENVVLIGSELIRDPAQRAAVLERLRESGRTVVELTETQIRGFAGNALQLTGDDGPVLAMSITARAVLRPDQAEAIRRSSQILSADVSTIEASGGSVRCMLAGIHLPPR